MYTTTDGMRPAANVRREILLTPATCVVVMRSPGISRPMKTAGAPRRCSRSVVRLSAGRNPSASAALLKAADALGFRPALNRTTDLLQRRGAPAVFIGRLIPGLRITTTQVAGVSKISRLTFAAGLIPSVVVYIAIFVGLGALVGQPAVRMFHRAEHRFFVVTVTVLAALAVILSVRWLAQRGALSALEPIVLGVRRQLADTIDAAIFRRAGNDEWRQFPLVR